MEKYVYRIYGAVMVRLIHYLIEFSRFKTGKTVTMLEKKKNFPMINRHKEKQKRWAK